ncbi:MAG TPA: hypothetical protein VK963_02635 [Candidatus Saccharimonadales bacterium]|nr:hypothetical protein [Candidatus Saccharimonadales bacterium]
MAQAMVAGGSDKTATQGLVDILNLLGVVVDPGSNARSAAAKPVVFRGKAKTLTSGRID